MNGIYGIFGNRWGVSYALTGFTRFRVFLPRVFRFAALPSPPSGGEQRGLMRRQSSLYDKFMDIILHHFLWEKSRVQAHDSVRPRLIVEAQPQADRCRSVSGDFFHLMQ